MSDPWCVPGNHLAARVPVKTQTSRMYMYPTLPLAHELLEINQPKLKINRVPFNYKIKTIYFICKCDENNI